MTGSNRRHPGCKPDTLPTELTEQKIRLLFALSAASHLQESRTEVFFWRSYMWDISETQFLSDCRLSHAPPQRRDSHADARWLTNNKNGGPWENRTPFSAMQTQHNTQYTNSPNKAWAIFHHDRLHFLAYRLYARNHATRLLSVMPPRNTTYSVRPPYCCHSDTHTDKLSHCRDVFSFLFNCVLQHQGHTQSMAGVVGIEPTTE